MPASIRSSPSPAPDRAAKQLCANLKFRYHNGQGNNLFFYRDSKGNEVDLLLVNGVDFFPIEVKAGMTITRDYFRGLNHIARIFPNNIPSGSGIIYDGKEPQKRTDVSVFPFSGINRLLEQVKSSSKVRSL